jgi:hypothetical protein
MGTVKGDGEGKNRVEVTEVVDDGSSLDGGNRRGSLERGGRRATGRAGARRGKGRAAGRGRGRAAGRCDWPAAGGATGRRRAVRLAGGWRCDWPAAGGATGRRPAVRLAGEGRRDWPAKGGATGRRRGRFARARAALRSGGRFRSVDQERWFPSVDQQEKIAQERRAIGSLLCGGYRPSQGPDFVRAKLDEPAPPKRGEKGRVGWLCYFCCGKLPIGHRPTDLGCVVVPRALARELVLGLLPFFVKILTPSALVTSLSSSPFLYLFSHPTSLSMAMVM